MVHGCRRVQRCGDVPSYAALGLGSITVVAPLVAVFPLIAVVLSFFFLREERLHAMGLLGIVVSVAGVILLLTEADNRSQTDADRG